MLNGRWWRILRSQVDHRSLGGWRLVARNQFQTLHALKVGVQRPDESADVRRQRGDEEIGQGKTLASVGRALDPFREHFPRGVSRYELDERTEGPRKGFTFPLRKPSP